MDSWYIVQLKGDSNKLAERSLKKQGFKTFLHMQDFTSKSEHRFLTNTRSLFWGHMFVWVDLGKDP